MVPKLPILQGIHPVFTPLSPENSLFTERCGTLWEPDPAVDATFHVSVSQVSFRSATVRVRLGPLRRTFHFTLHKKTLRLYNAMFLNESHKASRGRGARGLSERETTSGSRYPSVGTAIANRLFARWPTLSSGATFAVRCGQPRGPERVTKRQLLFSQETYSSEPFTKFTTAQSPRLSFRSSRGVARCTVAALEPPRRPHAAPTRAPPSHRRRCSPSADRGLA